MIFYEHRKDLKLLSKNLFSKFDFVRVKKTFILFNDDDIINDIVEIMNKYIFNNDDNQENDRILIDNITLLLINEQNNDLKKSISKKDFY